MLIVHLIIYFRLAWRELGDMSTEKAMSNFIDLLDMKCFLFKPFLEAHVAQKQEESRQAQEKLENEEKLKSEQVNGNEITKEASIEEKKKRLIQDALNQQTYAQFRAYAEDQVMCPAILYSLSLVSTVYFFS